MACASKVDPLLADGALPPAGGGGNDLVARWLSTISQVAPPRASQQALLALLPIFICHGLVFDPVRSLPGHLFFTLAVTSGITNRYSTLHGGAIGSLVEVLGCAAIRSITGSSNWSASDINISYLSGTPVKEEIELEARVLRVGKKIAVAAVDVRNKNSAKPAAQGRITMYYDVASKL